MGIFLIRRQRRATELHVRASGGEVNLNDLIARADQLIALGEVALSTQKNDAYAGSSVDTAAQQEFRSSSLSFIERVYGRQHPYFEEFHTGTDGFFPSNAKRGIAVIKAIRSEISGGWLFTVRGLVAAELFADFLDMASHLLDGGYKDAAAVMIGSTLEEHLRQLCIKNGIPVSDQKDGKDIPRKADRLNSELASKNVYSKLDQKVVTAWLDLRNKAAHGNYSEYNSSQVSQMLVASAEFMARVKL